MPKFEINLGDKWGKFEERENETLLKAFVEGKKQAEFHSRGQDYYVDFAKMIQRNKKTGKERQIRVAYDQDGKKPHTPKPSAAQALYPGPAAGAKPSAVAHGVVVGHTPGAAPSSYSPGGVYEPGRPAAYGHGVPAPGPAYTPGGAMPYGSPCGCAGPAYATPGPAYAAPGGACAPPYCAGPAYAGPGYGPGPAYGPPPSGGGGGMGAGGAMMAAGGAGLLGGLLLGEIFD